MFNRKCDLTAKFYMLKAESDDSIEQKLVYYNTALSNAKSQSIILDVFKKRVKIYADLKYFRQCSENEEWIQEIMQESQELVPLLKRKHSSENIKKKLRKNSHPQVPNVLNSLGISNDNKLVTIKPIKSATLIASEDPFCGVVSENALYRRCKNCLKSNNMNLIPCIKCQLAMFCSKDCHDSAKFHHEYECEATQIAKVPFNFGGIQVGLRSCFEILSHFNGSVEDMIEFVQNCKKQTKTIFDIDASKPTNIEKQAVMISLKHFSTNDCLDELTQTIKKVLPIYPKIIELFATESHMEFLIDFLIMQSTLDFIVHYDRQLDVPTALSVNFMYNLMDHSCASNIFSILLDGKLHYFTKYPLKKGDVLYYNHIFNFEESSYDIRKLTAKKCYEYDCKCAACTKQYPLFNGMKIYQQHVLDNAKNQVENMSKMNKKDLKNLLRANQKYIDSFYSSRFPSQEIYMLHLSNSQILSRLMTEI
ncbi:uncharacterized protein [Chironomus tepperi]|uniref:uncharacterized protein n=1 Tax=Chironomus tepperi TaxID=113505 RepID=UPI00391EE8CB